MGHSDIGTIGPGRCALPSMVTLDLGNKVERRDRLACDIVSVLGLGSLDPGPYEIESETREPILTTGEQQAEAQVRWQRVSVQCGGNGLPA